MSRLCVGLAPWIYHQKTVVEGASWTPVQGTVADSASWIPHDGMYVDMHRSKMWFNSYKPNASLKPVIVVFMCTVTTVTGTREELNIITGMEE